MKLIFLCYVALSTAHGGLEFPIPFGGFYRKDVRKKQELTCGASDNENTNLVLKGKATEMYEGQQTVQWRIVLSI